MKSRTWVSGLVICAAVALAISSCSKNPAAPKAADIAGPPDTFPPIPQPPSPNAIIPDTSSVYSADVPIAGKQVDFAPLWSAGTFTWHIEVQTQRGPCLACTASDPPGGYYDGTEPNSALVFESGAVDLRNPIPSGTPGTWDEPQPRRIEFVQSGADVVPFNPDKNDTYFLYLGYAPKHIVPALFGGYVIRPETPDFGETSRQAEYFVAALSCPRLTNPVFVRRERYWQRVGMNGSSNLKSIRVDPGTQFQVSYTYSQGVNYSNSYAFTQTLNGEVSVGSNQSVVGAKLGGSLQQTFGTGVSVSRDTTVTVTRTFNGVDGKTVIYSVWTSVERYTFVDKDGNPYTDPNFTFADLGSAVIQGEYEWISSTSFPYGTAAVQPAAAQPGGAQPATGQRAAARSVDGKAKVLSVTW